MLAGPKARLLVLSQSIEEDPLIFFVYLKTEIDMNDFLRSIPSPCDFMNKSFIRSHQEKGHTTKFTSIAIESICANEQPNIIELMVSVQDFCMYMVYGM